MLAEADYAALMNEKEAAEKAAFGPKPTKVVHEWYETKWRSEPALHAKIAAVAKIEEMQAELRSGSKGKISVNGQVNYALEAFIKTYEANFGTLPTASDPSSIRRYAKRKLEMDATTCPSCGQKLQKK